MNPSFDVTRVSGTCFLGLPFFINDLTPVEIGVKSSTLSYFRDPFFILFTLLYCKTYYVVVEETNVLVGRVVSTDQTVFSLILLTPGFCN